MTVKERIEELKKIYSVVTLSNNRSSVDIDFVQDSESTQAFAARYGLHAATVDPHGPGGGHPVIRFTGPTDKVLEMLDDYDK
jgi:hypothetical protein